jgi:hypothetical protein
MKNKLIEIGGWFGAVAIIGAYALNSFGILSSSSLSYQLINVLGAVGLAVLSFSKKAYQPGVVNTIWTTIALGAIVKIIF